MSLRIEESPSNLPGKNAHGLNCKYSTAFSNQITMFILFVLSSVSPKVGSAATVVSFQWRITSRKAVLPSFGRNLNVAAQDRSPFCILHILNEISQHPELLDTFLVGNHCHIF